MKLTTHQRAETDGAKESPREAELRQQVELLNQQLLAIHSSRMWQLWMAYLGLRNTARRAVAWPLSGVLWLSRLLWTLPWVVWQGVSWLFLLLSCGIELARARWRRVWRGQIDGASASSSVRPEAGYRPRVLIVSPYPIHPPNHGGAVRLYNLIKLLSRDCDLYLLIFIRERDDAEQRAALEPYCKKVSFHHWQPRFDRPLGKLLPPNARIFESHRAGQRVLDLLKTHRIDVLQLEYTELAQYRRLAENVKVIVVEHDIAFRSLHRRRQLGFAERYPGSKIFGATFGDWMRLLRYEVTACRQAEQVHVMSAEDSQYLAAFLPDGAKRIRIVPNGVDTSYYCPPTPAPKRRGVLLTGNFENLPNVDAFEHFTERIWPLLRALRPNAELTVVGAKMPQHMYDWDGRDGVQVLGRVPDLRPFYHGHQVLAVPLRAGSGTRLKLFEAFAAGIPSVSTTLGAEGIDYIDGTHLLLADTPEDFVQAMVRLLDDETLSASISAAAMHLAGEKYDWSFSARSNLEGIRDLIGMGPRPESGGEALSPRVLSAPEQSLNKVEISVVIPTLNGGKLLEVCLEALAGQKVGRPFEVVCVDSGSSEDDLEIMRRFGVRLHAIEKKDFNHGLTRDLGASLALGSVLVFINQDAVPRDEHWLEAITEPFFAEDPPAAVQGGILEFPHGASPVRRFFWDSCGLRFYFTRETDRWLARYHGVSFSTVNAAIRREVWEEIPFGWAPIMEDKKWQREALEAGYTFEDRQQAAVFHTHDYTLGALVRRCQSEGLGWRLLGESYSLLDMLRDMATPRMWKELLKGLRERRVKMPSELLFPWIRPWMLYFGNRWVRDVKH